ncbi:MAG TPA: hypothetical protein VF656_03530 [Pyrinomonadaceae bacterium]|jgi:hypothetical protein
MSRFLNYFTNFEFYWDRRTFGASLQRKRKAWTLAVYILLSLGIFSRQITAFPKVDINIANVRVPVLAASFIIGLALLPPVMRWISKKVKQPKWEHVLSAFSIGFFIDLTNDVLISKVFTSLIK